MSLTVGIPTCDRQDVLSLTLGSLLPEVELIDELIILDNPREKSALSSSAVRGVLDILNITTKVRILKYPSPIGNLGSKLEIMKECRTEYLLILDDDTLLDKDCLDLLYGICMNKDAGFCVPLHLLPNNEAGFQDYVNYTELLKGSEAYKIFEQNNKLYAQYRPHKVPTPIKIKTTQVGCIMINMKKAEEYKLIKKLSKVKGKLAVELPLIAGIMKEGYLIPSAKTWHLSGEYNERKWSLGLLDELSQRMDSEKIKKFMELLR